MISANAGVNIWLAMLVVAPLFVGLVGLIVERCLIRFLYGRMVDTMLATWGLSLLIIGLVTSIFGNTMQGVPPPLGGFAIGAYRTSYYKLFLLVVAIAIMAIVFAVLRYTRFGLIARAAMQNPDMAAVARRQSRRMSTWRPSRSARRSRGSPAGVLAPVSGVTPAMGAAYVAKAFITVVGGGAAIISGTVSASACSARQPARRLLHHPGLRRGDPVRHGDRADPPAAAGHHRPLLQGDHSDHDRFGQARPAGRSRSSLACVLRGHRRPPISSSSP